MFKFFRSVENLGNDVYFQTKDIRKQLDNVESGLMKLDQKFDLLHLRLTPPEAALYRIELPGGVTREIYADLLVRGDLNSVRLYLKAELVAEIFGVLGWEKNKFPL